MKPTLKKIGDLLCGMVETLAAPGMVRGEIGVSFYFEINSRTGSLEMIDDGEISRGGEVLARFNYRKGGDMVVYSRNYAEISKYAQVAETAINDLVYYYKNNK